ncbi:MAG: hypothetical protein HY896_11420 [Deltaproteobacteria bacterium]|nr:hypothetical protein [Deltaproteobacteria bacterium]
MRGRARIKFRFVFASGPSGSKTECFLCGQSFPVKGVRIALHAKDGEKVLADDATPICADCIFSGPKQVAERARLNALRFRVKAPKMGDSDEQELYLLSADILETIASVLEKMEDFSRVESYRMAAKVAEAYIN